VIKLNLLQGSNIIYRRIGGRVIPIVVRTMPRGDGHLITRAYELGKSPYQAGKGAVGYMGTWLPTPKNKFKAWDWVGGKLARAHTRAHVGNIEVNPEYRGQGIAKFMMAQLMAMVRKIHPKVKYLHGDVISPEQIKVRAGFHTKFLGRKGADYHLMTKEAALKRASFGDDIAVLRDDDILPAVRSISRIK
jgi:GNAT superfamily N-acetyltransferase